MNEKNEMKTVIKEHITEEECKNICDDKVFNCIHCSCFEDCYGKACKRCDEEFADSIDCGGYNSSEDFWEQVYD